MHLCPLKGSSQRFPMTDSESVSLGNILFTATLILEDGLFQRCYPCSNTPTTGLLPKSIPSQQCCQASLPKRTIMCSHVWANKTTLAGHRSIIGLCMQRQGRGLFSPLSLFNEELYKTCPHRTPRTHQDFKDENGAWELFSGRKPGTEARDRSSLPTSETAEISLKQNTEEKPTWSRFHPMSDLISCSATAHQHCQGF